MSKHSDTFFNEIARTVRMLPPGSRLFLQEIPWEDCVPLSDAIHALRRARLVYDAGSLEITTTSMAQEYTIKLLDRFMFSLLRELEQPIEGFGCATLMSSSKYIDPDSSYYIQNAHFVIGKDVDFSTIPPPDLVFEVAISTPCLDKFPIYSAIGVPEIWKYQDDQVKFYHLSEGEYEERLHSLAFPFLTSELISRFVPIGLSQGQSAAGWAFADWVRANKLTA